MFNKTIKWYEGGTIWQINFDDGVICADNLGTEIFLEDRQGYDQYLIDLGKFFVLYCIERKVELTKHETIVIDLREKPDFDVYKEIYISNYKKGFEKARSIFDELPNKRIREFNLNN